MTNTKMSFVADARTTRRRLIQGASALTLMPVLKATAAPSSGSTKTFVLVHGAWHGGWCWATVAQRLRTQGQTVFAPTLTGCGERLHLTSANITLRTHVTDILAVLHYENLKDVILVGHSYAGLVISQVASEAANRIQSLIYLDAFVPDSGQSFVDLTGQELGAGADHAGLAPMLTVEELGIFEPNLQAFVEERLTPHPLGALQQKVEFDAEALAVLPRAFIQSSSLFAAEAEKAAALGFSIRQMNDAGHDVMITQPFRLAQVLLDAAEPNHSFG